jgi:hypothetical protein
MMPFKKLVVEELFWTIDYFIDFQSLSSSSLLLSTKWAFFITISSTITVILRGRFIVVQTVPLVDLCFKALVVALYTNLAFF